MDAGLQLVEGHVQLVVIAIHKVRDELLAGDELLGEDAHDTHLVLDAQPDGRVELHQAVPLDRDAALLLLGFKLFEYSTWFNFREFGF